jgi:hypothetical protein
VATATTRPTKLGQPFTRWSIRKLAAYLRKVHGRVIRIGREALRCLLRRRGITFQRTKTWKESPDPDRDAKLDRIEQVLERFPDRVFAFDEFGPLGIRPTAGSCWAKQGKPNRLPATYRRTHGVTYFHTLRHHRLRNRPAWLTGPLLRHHSDRPSGSTSPISRPRSGSGATVNRCTVGLRSEPSPKHHPALHVRSP